MKSIEKYDWPIVGHDKIQQFLKQSIANQTLAHAYLFHGHEKIGKFFTAITFAKTLLCQSSNKVPCLICKNCQQVDKGIYSDLFIVKRLFDEKKKVYKKNISAEQIRELIKKVSNRSFLNSYKIVIIKEAEKLSITASNALLKTLEEPTNKTIFILLATNKDLLLPTILSRTQHLKFLPISFDKIYNNLVELGCDRVKAKQIAKISFGSVSQARQLFGDENLFADYKQKVNIFCDLMAGNLIDKFKYVDNLILKNKKNDDLILELNYWNIFFRDILLVNNFSDEKVNNLFVLEKLQNYKNKIENKKILKLIEQVEITKDLLNKNINSKLALENLIINI